MLTISLGEHISKARKEAGLTQAELADKCRLDIRTIQRIENGKVIPRSYTVRLISEALAIPIDMPNGNQDVNDEIERLRIIFKNRKKIRIMTAMGAIFMMIAVTLLAFPSWELFGMPKHAWAPFFYTILFVHLLGIALYWRCPGFNSLLGGDIFNIRFCSKCGLKLD